ncbi:hypothetical protein Glove_443g85 [Diversispora epigaea]|uniref:Uncharacterized protein n=1 Tax=Diversispora epigaea TaxID=1348612 RepID=A0A397GRV8_9GLOM|nr:hypothetical protein Glove_443g85 [Diversispora epigaea]
MKFVLILTIFLTFIVVASQATPMNFAKRAEVGPNVSILGVRFEGYYAAKVAQLKDIYKNYDSLISSFNELLPKAAEEDKTEVPSFLLSWSSKYADLVKDLKATTKELDHKVKKLGEFLSA